MSTRTLMLTPWMAPHRVISWQRAIVLFYLGKVEVLEEYDDRVVAPSITIRTPAVVRLRKGNVASKHKVRFSRMNVFTRDGFRCQYCGVRKGTDGLNYDHVLPRVHGPPEKAAELEKMLQLEFPYLVGGKTAWENIVTSCYACNDRKGSRTPDEAGMQLLRKPTKPTSLPLAPVLRTGHEIPSLWMGYCSYLLPDHQVA